MNRDKAAVYAKGIINFVGLVASLAVALGLDNDYKWIAVGVGVLSAYGVYKVPNRPAPVLTVGGSATAPAATPEPPVRPGGNPGPYTSGPL